MLCILKMKNITCLRFKHNSKCEKQIILLMIPKGEWWHYTAVKNDQHY